MLRPLIIAGNRELNHTSEVVCDEHFQKWWMALGGQQFQKHHIICGEVIGLLLFKQTVLLVQ